MVLGVGSIFAVYVYTMNQAMLFATVTPIMPTVDSFAVVPADILLGISLVRHRLRSTRSRQERVSSQGRIAVLYGPPAAHGYGQEVDYSTSCRCKTARDRFRSCSFSIRWLLS